MHNILIIDDVVSIEQQNRIENSIFSRETKWTFGRTVFYEKDPAVTKNQRNRLMSFTKPLFNSDLNEIDQDIDLYLQPLFGKFNTLLTSRIQLQLPVISELDIQFGVPHIDGYRKVPYKVAVYYVNDSDGDTVLFKEKLHDVAPEDIPNTKLTVDQSIPPKKGRLIIFDGDIYHAVGKPKTDLRCIINYNFI